jgi:hypothetical protein
VFDGGGGTSWTASITIDAGDRDGLVGFTATIADEAGNETVVDETITLVSEGVPGSLLQTSVMVDNRLPTVPTVTSLVTNNTMPTIVGTWEREGPVDRLSVEVDDGNTYVLGTDTELVADADNWSLSVPAGNELSGQTYGVSVTAVEVSNELLPDTSTAVTDTPYVWPESSFPAGTDKDQLSASATNSVSVPST